MDSSCRHYLKYDAMLSLWSMLSRQLTRSGLGSWRLLWQLNQSEGTLCHLKRLRPRSSFPQVYSWEALHPYLNVSWVWCAHQCVCQQSSNTTVFLWLSDESGIITGQMSWSKLTKTATNVRDKHVVRSDHLQVIYDELAERMCQYLGSTWRSSTCLTEDLETIRADKVPFETRR